MKTLQPDPIIAEVWSVRNQLAPGLGTMSKQSSETFRQGKKLLAASSSGTLLTVHPAGPEFRQPGKGYANANGRGRCARAGTVAAGIQHFVETK